MTNKLHAAYRDYFPIGAAVNPDTIQSHKETIINHFSGVTAENQMKPQFLHPSEHIYNFEQGDIIADFAAENNMLLRGHTQGCV